MKKSYLLGVVCACAFTLLAANTNAGGIRKWVDADGNVHFGDAPPPSVTNSEKVKVQESYSPSAPSINTPDTASGTARNTAPISAPATSDYYSPQNQLRRMEVQKSRERLERQQKKSEARSEELYRIQKEVNERSAAHNARVNEADCELYTAKLKEHEYQMQKGYSSEGDKLNQEKRRALLNSLKVRFCR